MKNSNRTLWIVLAVVVIMLCGCCFALVLFLAPAFLLGIPWTQDTATLPSQPATRVTETTEHVFMVGRQPDLLIDSFAGGVEISPGTEDEILVVVTKSARNRNDLGRIDVEMQDKDGGLIIENSAPKSARNAWVKLEIRTPVATTVNIETGSGSLELAGLDGTISAHTGSGSIDLSEVTGSVDASTGVALP